MDTRTMQVDKSSAVADIMGTFDFTKDGKINEDEFIRGCHKWIDEANLHQSSEHGDHSRNTFLEIVELFKKKEENPQEIDRMMSKILKHSQTKLLKAKSLVTEDGKPNTDHIRSLFRKFDTDNNNEITPDELEKLLTSVKFGEFEPNYQEVVQELFKDFDKDNNNIIDQAEFVEALEKHVKKAIRHANTPDRTKSIDVYDQMVWKQKVYNKWDFLKSVFQVLFGITILTFLGGPLMGNIMELSMSMRLPSYCVSFVIVPLAMNANTALTAFWKAKGKTQRTASLTFSEIYGGVIMNNLTGLTTLLAIVYFKGLTWNFSAEVLTVLVVSAIIGILANKSPSYRLWTCMLAFGLYPFSLGLFYFFQTFLSLN